MSRKFANTEQLGRLIELCGNTIELTRGDKRDPQDVYKVVKALQKFKDQAHHYHICSCGYPHYSRTLNNSAGYFRNAIMQLCQLNVGLDVLYRYRSEILYSDCITRAPFFENGYWYIK